VTVRGENYVSVLDGETYEEKSRIITPSGPGMTIFSPDGPTDTSAHPSIGDGRNHRRQPQDHCEGRPTSPFCPNIAASPDGEQVWFTLKDTGRAVAFQARPPFAVLKVLDTGRSPITSTSSIRRRDSSLRHRRRFERRLRVFRTSDFVQGRTIPGRQAAARDLALRATGRGSTSAWRIADELTAIDTATNAVIANVPHRPSAASFGLCAQRRAVGPGSPGCSLWACGPKLRT